jgi:uncharacterized protein with von Willebrand factor type A (vWA) domain
MNSPTEDGLLGTPLAMRNAAYMTERRELMKMAVSSLPMEEQLEVLNEFDREMARRRVNRALEEMNRRIDLHLRGLEGMRDICRFLLEVGDLPEDVQSPEEVIDYAKKKLE